MSAIPARTRSTRLPAGTAASGSRADNPSSSSAAKDTVVQRRRADSARLNTSQHSSPSPSRLPTIKPLTRSNTVGTSNSAITKPTTQPSRTPSIFSSNVTSTTSTRARPTIPQKSSPSTTSRTTRASSISNSNNASSTTMRPPPRPLRSTTTSTINTSMPPPPRPRSANSSRLPNPPVTRSSTTGVKHTRNSSASTVSSPRASHTRTPSLQTTLQYTTANGPRSPRSPPNPKKPSFSTLQQHYSPIKSFAPKATTATILAPPTPSKLPENIAKTAETSKLQAELLALHLLHREAADVSYQWHTSAQAALHTKFDGVAAAQKDLLDAEAGQQMAVNAEALRAWADSAVPGLGLEERCQVLDEVVTGVWSLSESGAKYSRLVRRFEKWVDRVGDVLAAREAGEGDVEFIEGLDGSWREECGVVLRKIEGWRARMVDVGGVEGVEGSTLGAVVAGMSALVKGMEEEIVMMDRMQREAVEREEEWIRAQNDEDDADDERSRALGTSNHHGIWRL